MTWQAGQTLASGVPTLESAYNNQRVQFLPGFCSDLPEWRDFIDHIEASKQRGDIDRRREYYFRAPIIDWDLTQHFTKIEKLRSSLAAYLNKRVYPTSAYINIATNEAHWPAHADEEDALFVQCEGFVTWILDDVKYDLFPGDAIYFPSMTMHEVRAKTPRAAFILAIE